MRCERKLRYSDRSVLRHSSVRRINTAHEKGVTKINHKWKDKELGIRYHDKSKILNYTIG